MPKPIRLLHFADIHIGMENYGKIDPATGISSRVMDFLYRLNEICDYAEDHDADLVIFAGDAFKTRQPGPTFQREFARRIKRLAKQCPVVLLVGNHDIPSMTQKASSIEIFHTLEVDNVIVGRTDKLHLIETKCGPIQVATVPYPIRQRLLSEIDTSGKNIGELDLLLREQLGLIIANLGDEVDDDIPAVLTGHFSVHGAKLGSEQGVMLGRDVAVTVSAVADPIWDYAALGHIHYHQDMNPGGYPPVVYSGSIERIDFGEEGAPKGFCWVNVMRGETTWEFVELPARPFQTIRVDVRGQDDPTAVILNAIDAYDLDEAVVRLIVTAAPENEARIREKDIEDALDQKAFTSVIQREIEYPTRARLGVERPEGLSPDELLERYLTTKDYGPDQITVLQEYAAQIFAEGDE